MHLLNFLAFHPHWTIFIQAFWRHWKWINWKWEHFISIFRHVCVDERALWKLMQHVLTHNNVVIMNDVVFFSMFPRQSYQAALKHLEYSAQDTWTVWPFFELDSLWSLNMCGLVSAGPYCLSDVYYQQRLTGEQTTDRSSSGIWGCWQTGGEQQVVLQWTVTARQSINTTR